ncbi:MAG: NADH-quinone oxidoreductase subunit NuoH [Chloroflexota bacterium]
MQATCVDVIETLAPCLASGGLDPGLAQFISILIGVSLVGLFPLVLVIILIWLERKIAARVQDRLGPNRVGPFGLFQNLADAVKLIIKEDITPAGADRLIFNLAPIIAVLSTILIWAAIPFSPLHIGANLGIGLLYIVAVSSIGTLSVMMAGWASNNKYALLGSFRVVAQLVSYEIPLVLALLIPVLLTGSMGMQDVVRGQLGMWFIVPGLVSAVIFYISNLAETGRAPFDMIEAESELVAGYNIEYSGMKFGLFMANEFMHAFTANLLFSVIFLGGWSGPLTDQVPVLGFVWLMVKTFIVYIPSLIFRATIPRVRIDQMMSFNWKFLVPIAIVNVIMVAFLLQIIKAIGWLPEPGNTDFLAHVPMAIILLAGNLALIGAVVTMLRNAGRRERQAETVPASDDERAIVAVH